ncbi:hypothetical protein [Acinetobacter sp. MF4640]|uniref:hypothetical protein n=1 Tax=Acinetobacter sp. MF4640 TaxID=1960826 RepID=UPI00099565A6|nr:hypothetical protein [Acinetobacter sp. MF4640]OOW09749.1 hypothetical protein MF4640_15905 [Acinetobacter sp. MF4640]
MSMRLESLIKLGDVLNGLYGDLEHYEIQDTWNSESKDTWSKLVKHKLAPILDKIRVKQVFYTTDNIIEIKNSLLNIKNTLSTIYNNFNREFRDERIILSFITHLTLPTILRV